MRSNGFGIYYFSSLLNASGIELSSVPVGKKAHLVQKSGLLKASC